MKNKIAPHLQPLTKEEQSLLDAYSEVRALEKLAAQAASDAAKAVLAAADEEYQKKTAKENGDDADHNGESGGDGLGGEIKSKKDKKRKKKKKLKPIDGSGINEDDIDEMSSDGSEQDSDEEDDHIQLEKERRRQDTIDRLRDDIKEGLREEQKTEESMQKEEALRRELLRESSEVIQSDLPTLKKKRDFDTMDLNQPTSLIANMDQTKTPPHDFSKTLKMSRVTGSQLFPDAAAITPESLWTPPEDSHAPDEGCLELELPDFDPKKAVEGRGVNTLAVKFYAPKDSKRFSINIAAPDHDNYYSVLFHFNPRQFEKGGQVVINDKKSGTWGQAINIPLSTFPVIFGEMSSTLVVQITSDGFDVFMNNQHCARLEHRVPLPNKKGPMMLQFPSTDDSGRTENWSVYKVWWGHKELMAGDDITHIAGVNIHSSLHETKLFISGLSKIYSEAQIDLRRAELERAFQKYGGALGVTATCPPKCSFAFVEVESYRLADLAIREMSSKYKVNRARKSRHEALMDERAAAEAASGGAAKDDSGWN